MDKYMKTLKKMSILLLIIASLFATSWVNAAGIGNNIAVRLVGTGEGYDGYVLFHEFGLDQVGATCFDLDLVDAKTGKIIGQASDCLSDINIVDETIDPPSIMLTGTTFFFFPGGTLVSRGLTTVQPVLHGSADFTHITGAIPSPFENSVIYGDGKFKNAEGPVRLSGAVNLSALGDGLITFDCVFIIDI